MKNKECYLVMVSSGEWEDNVKFNTGTVFLSLLSAEKAKKELEEYYTTEEPCPIDVEKYGYFGEMSEEDLDKYDAWMSEKSKKEEFNNAWIEKLKLKD